MLVEIPLHKSVARLMGYLKSLSSQMIFDKHANLEVQKWEGISGAVDIR